MGHQDKYFFIFVRKDLSLPQQICQAVHAAYESGLHLAEPTTKTHFTVVCQVPNEESLLKAQFDVEQKGIRTVLFREPDIGNQATAFATEPIGFELKRKLSKYELWKEELCFA